MSESNRNYANILVELGRNNPAIIVLDAGLATSMQTELFQKAFPDRYFNLGIAEQNAASLASGLARRGWIPLLHTFSNFLARRAHDQIALSIAWPGCNVKLIGGSCGLFDGRNGPSHMAVEDLAVMMALPGMTVVEPGDMAQTEALLAWIVQRKGPAYLRLRRNGQKPNLAPGVDRRQGTAVLRSDPGARCTLVACGSMLEETLRAADRLEDAGLPVDLIHLSVLRPNRCEPIVESASHTGLVVTVENHVPSGAFGDAVARSIGLVGARHARFALPDEFIPAGDPTWQMRYCRLDAESIAERLMALLLGREHVQTHHAVSGIR